MSGIAGIVDFSGRPVAPSAVSAMTAEMSYRGPDGIAHWHDDSVALGQCMFHTTPEAREADLPLTSADGDLVLVMDGRVDNHEDLRRRVLEKGGRLRNGSDAELVLAAYALWGEACLREIDGDFAIAIWDARSRHLYCGRDRLGFKPFHYHWNGKRFSFASDIAALQKSPEIPTEIDETMIAQVMSGEYHCQERTIWTSIKRLPTAHFSVVTSSGPRLVTYWMPDMSNSIRYRRQEDYVEHYRELLFDEVRRASRTIGPVGCEVSGGLDSSAIFSVADALEKNRRILAKGVCGYTLKFAAGSPVDDLRCARAVAVHLGRAIQEIPAAQPPLDWFADFARHHRTIPPRPNASMHAAIHSAARVDTCRVVLTGIGGDEWLTGGPFAAAEMIWRGNVAGLFNYLASVQQGRGMRAAAREFARYGLYPLLPSRLRKSVRRMRGNSDAGAPRDTLLSAVLKEHLETCRNRPGSATDTGRDGDRTHLFNQNLDVLGDAYLVSAKETMELLASLERIELRAPLSSRRMIEFCFAVPQERRRWCGENRSIHRSAIAGLVPLDVQQRATKSVFDGIFRSYTPLVANDPDWRSCLLKRGWVAPKQLSQVVHAADGGSSDFAPHGVLWNLFTCGKIANLV